MDYLKKSNFSELEKLKFFPILSDLIYFSFISASNLVVQPNFPILGRDEVDRGKPRYLTLELNSESGDEKVVFDRKNPQK